MSVVTGSILLAVSACAGSNADTRRGSGFLHYESLPTSIEGAAHCKNKLEAFTFRYRDPVTEYVLKADITQPNPVPIYLDWRGRRHFSDHNRVIEAHLDGTMERQFLKDRIAETKEASAGKDEHDQAQRVLELHYKGCDERIRVPYADRLENIAVVVLEEAAEANRTKYGEPPED